MKLKTTYKEFLNEVYNDQDPYYNVDFKDKLVELLTDLGMEDIEFEEDGISFHNPNYNNDVLINQHAPMIYDFINEYGYDADGFIIRNSRIVFPKTF